MLSPLPAQKILAARIREELKRITSLLDEFEASIEVAPVVSDGVFKFGREEKVRRKK
jgi:hypothetical protein